MRRILKWFVVALGSCLALIFLGLAVSYWSAHLESSRDEVTLDRILSIPAIDQVEVVNSDQDKTNMFVREEARAVAATFARTNRVPWTRPNFFRLYFAGWISIRGSENSDRRTIAYIPAYDAASYGEYYFRLKGTNDLRRLFELSRTNEPAAAIPR